MIPVEIAEMAKALAASDGRGDYNNDDILKAYAVSAALAVGGFYLRRDAEAGQ